MLIESYVAAIGTPSAKPNTSYTKDVGIFLHEHQPTPAPRALFKKSATGPNCVAVSRSHIFAAQIDKAVVHVYNREKGAQEATVPFPEKITSLCLALEDTVIVLGTEGGRVCLWEIATGRSLTGPQSHLQPVTALAVDTPSQYLLSGSADSNIHVWSLQSLLSFTASTNPSPIHTLSNHRGAITALAVGHSKSAANIVISASKDNTAIVWDYKSNQLLATYLLGDAPLALALDAADRMFFATYEDGSVQAIDFYENRTNEEAGEAQAVTDSLRDIETSYTPIQPPSTTRWHPTNQDLGAALSITLSWDQSTLLTGHASGKITSWSVVAPTHLKSVLTTLPGSVTNIAFLPPTGFPRAPEPRYKISAITKPRQDLKAHVSDGEVASPVPAAYAFNSQLVDDVPWPKTSSSERPRQKAKKSWFDDALTCSTGFSAQTLEASLAELASFTGSTVGIAAAAAASAPSASTAEVEADFMAVDTEDTTASASSQSLERENKELKEQIAALQRVQKATFKQLEELREKNKKLGDKSSAPEGDKDKKEKEKKRRERLNKILGSDED